MGDLREGQDLLIQLTRQILDIVIADAQTLQSLARTVESLADSQKDMRKDIKELSEKLN